MKNLQKYCVCGLFGIMLLVLSSGCASTNPAEARQPQIVPLPAGVTLHKDRDIQGVWLAPGFDFKGYDLLYVGNTAFNAVERSGEKEMRSLAISYVQTQEVEAIRASGLFKIVTMNTNDIVAGGRALKLDNTIIEYEKGGGGARYWAGLYGAGQPVVKVRGLMYDGDRLVFFYEAKRSGDSGSTRMFGGFMSDQEIQRNDINDLSVDLAGFMKRTVEAK